MANVYESELHNFIEAYLNAKGGKIIEKQSDFFIVIDEDGNKKTYTYSPRIAAENNEISLLAKGSKELKKIISEAQSRALTSEVLVKHSFQSIKNSVRHKDCCEMCPFTNVCTNVSKCCDLCPNYKICNSFIANATLKNAKFESKDENIDIICFIFNAELSNDYTLGQKSQKNILVPIDLKTGKPSSPVFIRDLCELEILKSEAKISISSNDYDKFLNSARSALESLLSEHLEVFKKEIQEPLQNKILSITSKFEDEYTENYSRISLDELEAIENEALKLCHRELSGYALNKTYSLQNVIIIHSSADKFMLQFDNIRGQNFSTPAKAYLGRVSITCSLCNSEIDSGNFCEHNHLLCNKCTLTCSHCGKIICEICEDEDYVCDTCKETICSDCATECESCKTIVCPSHSYVCQVCNKNLCINCHELCDSCEEVLCKKHVHTCSECGTFCCENHISSCTECSKDFCDNHIEKCSVCNCLVCDDHAHTSAYSKKTICESHKSVCSVCNDIFSSDEVYKCITCGDILCPTHVKLCHSCHRHTCSSHTSLCPVCENTYCSCTAFRKCLLCDTECCSNCLGEGGLCTTCNTLVKKEIPSNLEKAIFEYQNYSKPFKTFISSKGQTTILYLAYLSYGIVISIDKNNNILSNKKINFIDNLKYVAKFMLNRGD